MFSNLLFSGVLLVAPDIFAAKLCSESFTHLDFTAISQQQERPKTRWTDSSSMQRNVERLREICTQRHGSNCNLYGVFGPSSMMWEVSRIPFLALFAETELYMQLAHPVGAQGVYDHSPRLLKDPIRRFQSTFSYLWKMTYGDFEESIRMSRLIHLQHSRVQGVLEESAGIYHAGEIYSATDADALHWVHATHVFSLLRLYETLERQLSPEEEDRFFSDAKLFGMMLGVPEELLPNNASEFYRYFYGKLRSGELQFTGIALRLEQHFRQLAYQYESKNRLLHFARRYSDFITAMTLPQELSETWGFHRSPMGVLGYEATVQMLRLAYRHLPQNLRELPLYRIAMARIRGERPNPTDEQLQKKLTPSH